MKNNDSKGLVPSGGDSVVVSSGLQSAVKKWAFDNQGFDVKDLLRGLNKSVIESMLEAELDHHLGYNKHSPDGDNVGNSRNGYRSKKVHTQVGPVEIEVPRDRVLRPVLWRVLRCVLWRVLSI